MSTCGIGGGGTSQNIGGIYSAGKYPVFAICVRTQNDFNLKGGITAHSDNKTRLKRFIYIHIGHHAHKRNKNKPKMYIYAIYNYKLAYLYVKMC